MKIAKNDGSNWIMGGTSIAAPESHVIKPDRESSTNRQVGDDKTTNTSIGSSSETAPWFLDWYKTTFGLHAGGELYRAMEAAALYGKITPNPQYEFAAAEVRRGRIILVGDAAHTAVPRTAVGAHNAVLDGMALLEAFHMVIKSSSHHGEEIKDWSSVIEEALSLYSPPAVKRAQDLFSLSLERSKPVLPPGWSREASWTVMTKLREPICLA